eukprot:gb/GECG01003043.1/.p1 GENE.gb/GECG01003043.1/~~gb/GECG01003043.1/.p1  ORF type:complete len:134 (+),score=4.09 gb/GECG01003043.1/:1-402(+)
MGTSKFPTTLITHFPCRSVCTVEVKCLNLWLCFMAEAFPKKVTERATELVEEADGMLVLGSSLTVWSAFRLARAVSQECKPLAIINYGHTRADSLAPSPIKVEGSCSAALSYLNEGSPSVSIDIRKARASGQD